MAAAVPGNLLKGSSMTLTQRVTELAGRGIDMATMTMVFRSEGISDADIADAYEEVALYSSTEVERGTYYMRLDNA